MKFSLAITKAPTFLLASLLFVGCEKMEVVVQEEAIPAGASFKAGEGVSLTDETRRIIGVEVAEVTEEKLSAKIRFNVQVFGEKHHPALRDNDR